MTVAQRGNPPRAGGRYAHLDGLRGLAALVVMFHHCIITFDLPLTTGHPRQGFGTVSQVSAVISGLPFMLENAGNFCVCIFFCLSGFVLTLAFSRSRLGPAGLLAKRYVRLTVPMLATCLLSYGLLSWNAYTNTVMAAHTRSAWAATQFLQAPNFLAALSEGAWRDLVIQAPGSLSYNSTLWTMQVEFGGSLFLIVIISTLRAILTDADAVRRWGFRVFVLTAALACSTYLMPFSIGAALYLAGAGDAEAAAARRGNGWRLACYACLGAAALFFGTIPYSAKPSLAVAFFVHAPALPHKVPLPLIDPQAFWHVIGAAVLLFIVQSSGFWRRALACRVCRWLGDISFPLYLIHVPILCSAGAAAYLFALGHGSGNAVAVPAAVAVTIALSLTAAHLARYVVEQPSILLSDRAGRAVQAMVSATRMRRARTG